MNRRKKTKWRQRKKRSKKKRKTDWKIKKKTASQDGYYYS